MPEHFEQQFRDINPFVVMPGWGLDLRINADVSPGCTVQALNQLYLLRQSDDAKVPAVDGESARKSRTAGVIVQSLADIQRSEFSQIEIANVVAAIIAVTIGVTVCDIADTVKVNIVRHDQDIIPGSDDVLLEEIGPHGIRQGFGFLRVLRQVSRGATMSDDHGPVAALGQAQCSVSHE
jgi:hypothetical protein